MTILNDSVDEIKYVVYVNGSAVTSPASKVVAEMEKTKLPIEQQHIAEVVAVTNAGSQILYG